jgi:putative ABC transport system substrate-binding protein
MRRRDLIAILGVATLARPLAARAQPAVRKLGVLMATGEAAPTHQRGLALLRQTLEQHGWREGDDLHIDLRWSDGQPALIEQHAHELVALAPDVIVANGTPSVAALKPLTTSIPIVAAPVTDPVGFGFVKSLAQPGGNITGFSFIDTQILGKWTALLKEAAPGLTRAGVLYNPRVNPWYANLLRDVAATPGRAALETIGVPVETAEELAAAVRKLAAVPGTALIIGPEAFVNGHAEEVLAISIPAKMPGISVYGEFVTQGGLMSYGPDLADIFRLAAEYVDRILKGASPAALPVQEPTKFEFAINRKAATALDLNLSPTLLAGADEVIE